MSDQQPMASERPIPCLSFGGRCGVVRGTSGNRLYHLACVEAAIRDAVPALVASSLRYCVAHEGFIDCDQEVCDFARRDEDASECISRPLFYERPAFIASRTPDDS